MNRIQSHLRLNGRTLVKHGGSKFLTAIIYYKMVPAEMCSAVSDINLCAGSSKQEAPPPYKDPPASVVMALHLFDKD